MATKDAARSGPSLTAATERLLEGLEVVLRRVEHEDHSPSGEGSGLPSAVAPCPQTGERVLELAGGARLCLSAQWMVIQPPRPASRSPVAAGTRITSVAALVTYQGTVGFFDRLRDRLAVKLSSDDPIRAAFEEMALETGAQDPGALAMAELLLHRCLILFLRRYCRGGERRLSWLFALEDDRIARVVDAMRDHPEEPQTLWRLAEMAGMSRSVFVARFTASLGRTPMEFLHAVRLAQAVELLTRSNMPVKTVAARVGFSSRSSFSRAFRARYGTSPVAVRMASGPEISSTVFRDVPFRLAIRRGAR